MSLAEEDTEPIEDEPVIGQLVRDDIVSISQDLDGVEPGDLDVAMTKAGIISVLMKHHEWSESRVLDIYDINLIYEGDGRWEVDVRPKE